ncbi:MAG: hypothetical protein Q7S35_12965, partial [Candidatus Limnocylindrales bacterium]|nr:hypothetical protein [Candidatus Limnocylindrales bacterium]
MRPRRKKPSPYREVYDLNRFRKAISVGMSAALLASLFTAIAAPAALATAGTSSVTGPVSIGPSQTSTDPITINLTEGTVTTTDCTYNAAGGGVTIQLFDASGLSTVGFSGTPALSGAPGSLVSTTGFPQLATFGAGVANNQLKLSFDSTDATAPPAGSEPFSITGLKIKSTAAAAGGIRMKVVTNTLSVSGNLSCFGPGNVTVKGTTTAPVIATAISVPVTTTDAEGFCTSGAVTPPGGVPGSNGLLAILDDPSNDNVGVSV